MLACFIVSSFHTAGGQTGDKGLLGEEVNDDDLYVNPYEPVNMVAFFFEDIKLFFLSGLLSKLL